MIEAVTTEHFADGFRYLVMSIVIIMLFIYFVEGYFI